MSARFSALGKPRVRTAAAAGGIVTALLASALFTTPPRVTAETPTVTVTGTVTSTGTASATVTGTRTASPVSGTPFASTNVPGQCPTGYVPSNPAGARGPNDVCYPVSGGGSPIPVNGSGSPSVTASPIMTATMISTPIGGVSTPISGGSIGTPVGTATPIGSPSAIPSGTPISACPPGMMMPMTGGSAPNDCVPMPSSTPTGGSQGGVPGSGGAGGSGGTGGSQSEPPVGNVGNIVACAAGMNPVIVMRNGQEIGRAVPNTPGQWVAVQGLGAGQYQVMSGSTTANVTVVAGTDQSAAWACGGAGGGATGGAQAVAPGAGRPVAGSPAPGALPNTGDEVPVAPLAALGGQLAAAGLYLGRKVALL